MNEVFSILFVATFVEGLVEYLFGDNQYMSIYLKYVALFFGIIFAFGFKIDIPTMIGLTGFHVYFNYLVTGIILGRGSNYVNDLVSAIRK